MRRLGKRCAHRRLNFREGFNCCCGGIEKARLEHAYLGFFRYIYVTPYTLHPVVHVENSMYAASQDASNASLITNVLGMVGSISNDELHLFRIFGRVFIVV